MTYSYSKLNSFYECPHAFFRNYFLHEKGQGNAFSDYGILMHSILERYAKNQLKIEDLVAEFQAGFEMNISEIRMFGNDLTQSYFDKGVAFFQNFTGFWGLEPLESEYQFKCELSDKNNFIGIIDLIAKDKNENLIIIDHKSSSKFSKKELPKKARQLYLYCKAVYEKYKRYPTEIWFNHFKNNYIEKIKFNLTDYQEALNWALETIDKIENCMEFEPNTESQFYCSYLCDYRNTCEYR